MVRYRRGNTDGILRHRSLPGGGNAARTERASPAERSRRTVEIEAPARHRNPPTGKLAKAPRRICGIDLEQYDIGC